MNIKVVNNYLEEITIPECDKEVIDAYFLRMKNLLKNYTVNILPTDKLDIGLMFLDDGLKTNTSSIYKITTDFLEIKDANLSFHNFLQDNFIENYTSFLNFSKEMLETKSHFLKQHIDISSFSICIAESLEKSFIKMSYYKRLTNKDISLCIPLISILEGKKEDYRLIILTSLYKEYKSHFEEFITLDDFIEYAEDVFLQKDMIDY